MVTVAQIAAEAEGTTDSERLDVLGRHKSKLVRMAVAENPATSDGTMRVLLQDATSVRLWAAGNLADRPALHSLALSSEDRWVRAILAHTFARRDDRTLPYGVQRALASDEFFETRGRIAETTNYADLFESLLRDENPRVRGRCAANPRITLDQMERIVTDRSKDVRGSAAALGLQYPDDDQLVRLAQDRSAGVRWAVLFRPDRPRRAVELIAQDSDEINRQHAEHALVDNRHIMADQVVDHARNERKRVLHVQSFEQAPR